MPVRDFEAGITGGLQLTEAVDERPVYLVVFSTADDRVARLRAGEAYARVSVEAERLGLASSAMTQAVDLPAVRERFRMLMDWPDHPQMVLRVGHRQPGPTPAPTGRRPLTAVLRLRGLSRWSCPALRRQRRDEPPTPRRPDRDLLADPGSGPTGRAAVT